MFLRVRDVPRGSVLETDISIVGSGPAGLSLARELEDSGLRVTLLESGDFTPAPFPDPLYGLYSRGLTVSERSRVRAFGGTTALWAGKWKPFDPIDFVVRPWVPHSGWPISFEEISPYYERAFRMAGMVHDSSLEPVPDFSTSPTFSQARFYSQEKAGLRWGETLRSHFECSSSVSVYLGAHLVAMRLKSERVTELTILSPEGVRVVVRPRVIVLASGGLENPRHLLLSKIGQGTPVGRYYMDHPKGVAGRILLRRPMLVRGHSFTHSRIGKNFVGLRIRDVLQEYAGILNSHITLESAYDPSFVGRILRKVGSERRTREIVIRNYMEQEPLPMNHVHLGRTLDRFGRRKIHIHWSISELQKKTMRTFHREFGREVRDKDLGELKSPLLETGSVWPINQDASHHMGTTRMGIDPRTSVVDPTCRVHGVSNLYIAGSSVFPTGGYSNPTATIVALAIRLADHLKRV